MKILMVSEYFPPAAQGGGEHSAFLLAKHAKKVNITVLTSYFEGLKREEVIDGVRILRRTKTGLPNSISGNIKRQFYISSAKKEIRKIYRGFDLIHCMNISTLPLVGCVNRKFIVHINSPGAFCPKATLLYKDEKICDYECTWPRFLWCLFNSEEAGKNRLGLVKFNPGFLFLIRRNLLYMEGAKRANMCIATNEYMKERLLRIGVPEKRTRVLPNIIEAPKIKVKRKKSKITRILYVGAYLKSKGPHLLLDALKDLDIDYRADFYGKGYLRDFLEKKVLRLGLKDKVHIHSAVPKEKMPEIYASHDLVVVPSIVPEGFGRVAVEAEACGCEVVMNKGWKSDNHINPNYIKKNSIPNSNYFNSKKTIDNYESIAFNL